MEKNQQIVLRIEEKNIARPAGTVPRFLTSLLNHDQEYEVNILVSGQYSTNKDIYGIRYIV